MIKRSVSLLLSVFMLLSVSVGCSQTPTTTEVKPADVPTNAPVTLTMLCNWSDAPAKKFADAVHTKLPHITLNYEACPLGALPFADQVTRRVMHDAEADILMTTDTKLWNSGRLLNLTDEEFVSRYNLSIMKTLSGDGSVYFVPNVGGVLCYIYNAEWLTELNLQPPQTMGEMESVFAAMSAAGKPPFIVPYSQMPTQYVKVMIAGYLSTPKGQQWMSDYNLGKTTMAQDAQWQQLWKRIEEMTKMGYLLPSDMLYSEARRMVALTDNLGLMTTFSSSQDRNLPNETKDRLQVLPLLGEKPENQMIYTEPTSYFALSNRLSAPENSAKLAAALQVMDFISTTEAQELLSDTTSLSISYLESTNLPINVRYSNLIEIIDRGSFSQPPTFERGVEKVIADVFGKMVEGKMTAVDAIAACDKQNADYLEEAAVDAPVVGTAAEIFPWTYAQSRSEELAVINLCTDSMRKAAKTDYAIELGTAFRGELFAGDITTVDIESVIRQDKKIHVVEVTGQQIWDIIAQGFDKQYSSWFVAPSGFRYSYQTFTEGVPGKLLDISLEDGTPLDLQKSYTVAVSENQMMEIAKVFTFFGVDSRDISMTLREAVVANIKEQGTITPKLDGRIKAVAP